MDLSGGHFSDLRTKHPPISCATCSDIDCHSLHGPSTYECLLNNCYHCADLAKIDEEIANTCTRLSELARARRKVMSKPSHESPFHRMSVEMISSIFLFLKDAILGVRLVGVSDGSAFQRMEPPRSKQPSQSPPLLLGAVCKRWRDITLTTQQLWTDIIIDLEKSPDGQSNMVNTWARRSGVLPLNISVSPDEPEGNPEEEYGDVLAELRSLTTRWNDMSLNVPEEFFYDLFNDLHEAPHIQMLHMDRWYAQFAPIKSRHRVFPRCLTVPYFDFVEMPFKWSDLIFLDIGQCYSDEILDVIQHAQNLQFCLVHGDDTIEEPVSPITNRSLVYLNTSCEILDYLTLPSLSHLDYTLSSAEEIESIAGFFARSSPPLSNFILRYSTGEDIPIPSFERIPQITSLFIDNGHRRGPPNSARLHSFLQTISRPSSKSNTILPRLRALSFSLDGRDFSPASWTLIGDLFLQDTQSCITCGRPLKLSDLKILLSNRTPADQVPPAITKDSLLRLLEVKKSGVNLDLRDETLGDLLVYMANVYGVRL